MANRIVIHYSMGCLKYYLQDRFLNLLIVLLQLKVRKLHLSVYLYCFHRVRRGRVNYLLIGIITSTFAEILELLKLAFTHPECAP